MNEYIVGQLLETILIVLLCFCFLAIIVSSMYDVWMTRQQKAIHIQTKRLRRNRPHVTILVYAKNSGSVISECLESIIKNRYRQYDIVVVTNTPTDSTKQQLARFKELHPAARLRMYTQRKETTISTTLQQAYKRSQRGDIVLTLQPDTIIPKTFLKESVAHFIALADSRRTAALRFNEQLPSLSNLTTLLRHFPQASRQLSYKIASVLRLGRLSAGNTLSHSVMYKKIDFMNVIKGTTKKRRYVYDSTVALLVLPGASSLWNKKRSFNELLLFYAGGIIASLCVTYSLYMAMTLQNTALLLLGWLAVVIWFFVAVWSDSVPKISDKLRLSFALPSLYFFLYLMIVIEVVIRFMTQVHKGARAIVRGTILFYASQPVPFEE